jgi:hypothetical protein
MGIFYGDIHYGAKISKKIEKDDAIFLEEIYEVKFYDTSISLNDYLYILAKFYLKLLEPDSYRYELYVDITTTYNGMRSNKGWQIVTKEQMIDFICGMYKTNFLQNDN